MDYLREHHVEECVKNDEKPEFASFKDYQNIDISDDFNDLVVEFQEAIRNNNKNKLNFYGKKLFNILLN